MSRTLTANQQLMKQINKKSVLDMILRETTVSRSDIAQKLGLTKGTVSSLVNELIEDKLIYESGPGKSSGGRRPVMLIFNEKAGFSIGVDLGVNYILGLITDLRGNIVKEINKQLTEVNFEGVLPLLNQVIKELIEATPTSHYGIIGIGIGVPGLVTNNNKLLVAPNLGWKNIQLKKVIEDTFQIPVIVENEANAGAYGEKLYGSGRNHSNILYVSAGIGIGIGTILNGKLFNGMNGFAGEIGHMIVHVGGKNCSCGSSGCWELYASERALLNEAKKIPQVTEENLSIEKLITMANEGNEEIIDIFSTIGMYLGVGINNIVNIFNPELIIIGNQLAMAKEFLKKPINRFVKNHSMEYHQEGLSIQFSQLKEKPSALGVSAMSIDTFINKIV